MELIGKNLKISLLQQVMIFALIMAVVTFCYAPGLGGGYHFDDNPNLEGLTGISSLSSALVFIFGGLSEPLGRPISLASFTLQAYAWPSSPEVFLRTNIALHILNGILVIWLIYRILTTQGIFQEQLIILTALAGGAMWMMLPILASSSLFIVQRMTLLSAFFSLCGLIIHLSLRADLQRTSGALLWMTANIFLFTTLAVLSKESGVLLPIFVLIIESTLLVNVTYSPKPYLWLIWRGIFLFFPAALIIGFMLSHVPYSEGVILRRGFDAEERLLTQATFLWEYLYNAFIPAAQNIGPFHDDRIVVEKDHLFAFIPMIAWMILFVLAIIARRRYMFFSFAILWFLGGHLLESSTIALELYFEHRNYLPILGPVIAISSILLYSHTTRYKSLVVSTITAYTIILAVVLFSVTSTWGNPRLGAEIWSARHPDSLRAQTYLAHHLILAGEYDTALRVLNDFCSLNQKSVHSCLQALILSCAHQPTRNHRHDVGRILSLLPEAKYENSLSDLPELLHKQITRQNCTGVTAHDVRKIAQALLDHPRYQLETIGRYNLYSLLAVIEIQEGRIPEGLEKLDKALSYHISLPALEVAIKIAKELNKPDLIENWISNMSSAAPTHPIRVIGWRIYANELRKLAENQPAHIK